VSHLLIESIHAPRAVALGLCALVACVAVACGDAPTASGAADAIVVPTDATNDAVGDDAAGDDAAGDDATGDAGAVDAEADAATDTDATPPDATADAASDTADACTPGTEVCNGVDDDCDGTIDEGFDLGGACTVGVGGCRREGTLVCGEAGDLVCDRAAGRPDLEVCNGVDDDCDGTVDNACAACGTVAREVMLPASVTGDAVSGVTADGATVWIAAPPTLVRVDADGTVLARGLGLDDDVARFGLGLDPRGQVVAVGVAPAGGLTVSTLDDVGVRSRRLLTPADPSSAHFAIDGATLAVAWAEGGETWVTTVDLASEGADASAPPVSLGVGDVVGVALVAGRTTVALRAPSRLVAVEVGRELWSLNLAESGIDVAGLADDGERLAVVGAGAEGIRAATIDRREGRLSWQASTDGFAVTAGVTDARPRAVSFDAGGRVRIVFDGVVDGDRTARVALAEPGVGFVEWAAGWRYTTTLGAAATTADGVAHVGHYDGPTGERVVLRHLHRPCAGARDSAVARTWVLSGQSNMVGYGRVAELPAELAAPFVAVDMFTDTSRTIVPAGPASIAGLFGPEVSFAREVALAYPNERLMLVKYAVGGTNLYSQWAPGESADDPLRGGLYRIWQTTVANAVAANAARDVETVFAGMAWMQGESDGFDAPNAIAYAANLMRFVRRTRDDLGVGLSIPFAIGRIYAPTVPQRDIVRAGQAHAAGAVRGAAIVDTDDLPLGDVIHYDTGGTLTLGRRLAAAALHAGPPVARELSAPREPASWVGEAVDFERVWSLDVPAEAHWFLEGQVPYAEDLRADFADVAIDRVAWLLELDARDRGERRVWVSADPPDGVASLGVPVDAQQVGPLTGVRVASTEPTLQTTEPVDGRIEFWSSCYEAGADGLLDAFDVPTALDCYGSMQVHAALDADAPGALTTVLSFNRWATPLDGLDVTIGPSSILHPDGTFTRAGRGWESRRLSMWVRRAE